VTAERHPAPLDHRSALSAQQLRFLALAGSVDPSAVVPGCPGWSVADLVAHLTGVHRWAAAMTRTPPGTPDDALPDGSDPLPRADAAAGHAQAATDLLRALDEDPSRPCVTLRGAGRVVDWTRRQLHETLVHTWDLADAAALPRWAPPEVVADAVAEVVDTMQPRQVRLGRTPAPDVSVELLGSRRWVLGDGPLVASVTGSDAELLRLLWRRTCGPERGVLVAGDTARAAGLLGTRLTP
jgi:uncharacterized protein (TIGR03083 family)